MLISHISKIYGCQVVNRSHLCPLTDLNSVLQRIKSDDLKNLEPDIPAGWNDGLLRKQPMSSLADYVERLIMENGSSEFSRKPSTKRLPRRNWLCEVDIISGARQLPVKAKSVIDFQWYRTKTSSAAMTFISVSPRQQLPTFGRLRIMYTVALKSSALAKVLGWAQSIESA
jgi:hypothetical protein